MSATPTFRPPGTQPGGLSRVPYLPGLDGLRAIAVVAVMLYHANHEWVPGGFLGVEVFFVISGYLITLLLIGEQERTGKVDLRQFWFRRFRRLLPALFVMMAFVAVYITVAYTVTREQTRGDFLGGASYFSNWYQIWVGQSYTASEAFVPLRHLWSLAVEEQFYFIWPLVMMAILRRSRGRLPAVGLQLILASVGIAVVVAVLYSPGAVGSCSTEFKDGTFTFFGRCFSVNDSLYLSSISRSGGLMLGSGFAMLWRPMAIMRGPLRDKGKRLDVLAAVALAILVAFFFTMYLAEGNEYNAWLYRGGFLFTGVLTLVLIAAASHQGASAGPLLGNKVFLWIGTRSYGLYLYHWPIYQIIRKQANIELSVVEFVLAMLLTVPITEASYRFIETPIRKNGFAATVAGLKRAPMQVVAGGAVALTLTLSAYSMLSADPHCVGEVACDIAAAGGTEETTLETVPTDSTPPGDTQPGVTDSTTTTVPKEPAKFVAIGESVMIGAQPLLEGSGVLVQAKEGRGPEGVKNAVILLRDNGDIGLGTKIVIQVGTNAPLSQGDLDKIMAEVPTGTTGVVFMTLHAPGISYIAGNNELLRGMPSLYSNVTVIDWDAESANVQLCPDGIHISCNGSDPAKYYANLLLAQFGLPAIS
ncbi:MAG: acyltransferase family protein [Ilumatobacteraceae bacterium]